MEDESPTLALQKLIESSLSPDLDSNYRLRKFVKAYTGDLVYALRIAGFQGTDNFLRRKGQEILLRPDIQRAIQLQAENANRREENLLSKIDRMEFLAAIVRNSDPFERMVKDDYGQEVAPEPTPMPVRLKALDMYNKMEGDYHTNVHVKHDVNITDLILSSFTDVNRSIEAIEADYIEATSTPIPKLETLGL